MDIPVKFYTTARELFGKKQDIVILEQGGSVEDLLNLLFETRLPAVLCRSAAGPVPGRSSGPQSSAGPGKASPGGGEPRPVNGSARDEIDGKLIVFVNEVRSVDMRDVLKEGDRVSLFGVISGR